MKDLDVAVEIDLEKFSHWKNLERTAVNVATLHKNFVNDKTQLTFRERYELMAKFKKIKQL